MLNKDNLNWSADLRRISWWLQTGNTSLARSFIERGKKLYPQGEKIGNRDWSWWMAEISKDDADPVKAAERALTWSLMLR